MAEKKAKGKKASTSRKVVGEGNNRAFSLVVDSGKASRRAKHLGGTGPRDNYK